MREQDKTPLDEAWEEYEDYCGEHHLEVTRHGFEEWLERLEEDE